MVDLEGCENQVDLQDLHHSQEKNITQQMMKENEKSMDPKIVKIKVVEVAITLKTLKCILFLLVFSFFET